MGIFLDTLFLLFMILPIWFAFKLLFMKSNFVHWARHIKKAPVYITLKNGIRYKMKVTLVKKPEWSLFKKEKDFEIRLFRRYGIFPFRFWFNGLGPLHHILAPQYMYEDDNMRKRYGTNLDDFMLKWATEAANNHLDKPFFKSRETEKPNAKTEVENLLDKFS